MIRYMLDTNVCVDMLRGNARSTIDRITRNEIDRTCISAITLAELMYGAWRSNNPERNERAIVEFCAALDVIPFTDLAATSYGRVRANLERSGKPIGPMDTLIAAHALALNVILVTNNEREFRRVDELVVEKW